MVLDRLGESLRIAVKKIVSSIFMDETVINEFVQDIQRALLQADVNVKLVFELTARIKERALKELKESAKREQIVKIVYEELVDILGTRKELNEGVIMTLGLYGSGKTTTIAKLANYYIKRGKKVAAIGLDVHRPAAPIQLKQLCDKINVPCFIIENEHDPLKIYNKFKSELKKYDLIIVDTAGRSSVSKDLIEELKTLNRELKPQEKILVISADIGQTAQKQIEAFQDSAAITGIIVTKLDGTAKAGGALTACSISKAPILFLGTGEKINDLEIFNPTGFVSRLLGMGDLEALLEKAREIPEEKARDLSQKLMSGEFTLTDLMEQIEAIKKMGPLSKIIDLIPGLGTEIPKGVLNVQEDKLKRWKYIMQSMTKKELQEPEMLTKSRIERIAKGSGVSVDEVRDLIKHYKQSKKLLGLMKGVGNEQDIGKLMKRFKGFRGFKFK